MKPAPILSIIVPCYNEEEGILDTIHKLEFLICELKKDNLVAAESFILFVDDGSIDSTFDVLRNNKHSSQKIIRLTTNKGQQFALLAGLDYVKESVDCTISIDSDLQDDLTVIEKMLMAYRKGAEIVCGVRSNRDTDSFFKRRTAKLFYKIMHAMDVPLIENHSEFRLLSKDAIIELGKYKERNVFLRGLLPLINLKIVSISYTQNKRLKGETKYSFGRLLSLAIRGITSYSNAPIRFIMIIGFILFILTMFQSVYVLVVYLRGNTVPGWASITLPLLFFWRYSVNVTWSDR
ncbi:glycosyltransferase family 2 protein [Niabella sp. W65]|nr:glycosyltransferase family 2 protein [Niabella sp. W65]MCH7366439.1 glycosyltransferase family 2 protein [Niabella sp. W65]